MPPCAADCMGTILFLTEGLDMTQEQRCLQLRAATAGRCGLGCCLAGCHC